MYLLLRRTIYNTVARWFSFFRSGFGLASWSLFDMITNWSVLFVLMNAT